MRRAKELSDQFGVPETIVQIFINLSAPVRSKFLDFLYTQRTSLEATLRRAQFDLVKYDTLSASVEETRVMLFAVKTALAPVLNFIPLDTLVRDAGFVQDPDDPDKQIPVSDALARDVHTLVNGITSAITFVIPPAVLAVLSPEQISFFDGIRNFGDLMDRIDEIEVKLSRAVSASNQAGKAILVIETKLRDIEGYIGVLVSLG